MRAWRVHVALIALGAGLLGACQPPNHYLIHPDAPPARVVTHSEDVVAGELLIHLEWAQPEGRGPFATVLVHPEAGHYAPAMRGVIWDLASRGYVAVAADYQRMIEGRYRRSLFPWRAPADVTRAADHVRAQPQVDARRFAALGFSQGGVFSLLLAAHDPTLRAVVAYYPVTDFEYWLSAPRSRDPLETLVYRVIRWHFKRESGAPDEAEFVRMLHEASPLRQVERIRTPVLLIHGERDTSAGVEESRRLAERLDELGREVRLMVVEDAPHVFNFKQAQTARAAWDATLDWLARHLTGS